jgi:hypothetical protein
MTKARRLLWFVALVGPVVALVVRKRWAPPEPTAAPIWPPLEPEVPVPTPSAAPEPVTDGFALADLDEQVKLDEQVDEAVPNGDGGPTIQIWVAPVQGLCPATHPVKVNVHSGIYHVPGGRFYDRTRAERCYPDAGAAEADGYRAAKDRAAGREQ